MPGSFLHDIHVDVDCWARSTFPEHHSGQCWTHEHKHGQKKVRPDFVMIPARWRGSHAESWVDGRIHSGQVPDHMAPVCQIQAFVEGACGRSSPGGMGIDEVAVLDPKIRGTVEQIVSGIPAISCNVSAHTHAAVMVGHLQKELSAAVPPRPGQRHIISCPRKRSLSEVNWPDHAALVQGCRLRCVDSSCVLPSRFELPRMMCLTSSVLRPLPWTNRHRLQGHCAVIRYACWPSG